MISNPLQRMRILWVYALCMSLAVGLFSDLVHSLEQHVYCPIHHNVEHGESGHSQFAAPLDASSHVNAPPQREEREHHGHHACTFTRCMQPLMSPSLHLQLAPPSTARLIAPIRRQSSTNRVVWRLAPKTSPPAAIVT